MELTYILVDFENVQPQDLGLLDGQQYRVKVFHGSHQNKLDMAIVKALQPLGGHVEYVQSETPGKNALDFHVAFCLGRLLQAHQSTGMPARFAVISRDGGFDPLLRHVRSLGYAAKQAGSIARQESPDKTHLAGTAHSFATRRSKKAAGDDSGDCGRVGETGYRRVQRQTDQVQNSGREKIGASTRQPRGRLRAGWGCAVSALGAVPTSRYPFAGAAGGQACAGHSFFAAMPQAIERANAS